MKVLRVGKVIEKTKYHYQVTPPPNTFSKKKAFSTHSIKNKRANKQETTKAVGMALPGKGRKNKAKKDKNKKQFTQQFVDHE